MNKLYITPLCVGAQNTFIYFDEKVEGRANTYCPASISEEQISPFKSSEIVRLRQPGGVGLRGARNWSC